MATVCLLMKFISIFHLMVTYTTNTFTKRDYILVQSEATKNWLSAEQYCINEYDSHLASIITSADLELAYNYSSLGGFIGLNDIDQNGNWSWIDGQNCDSNNSSHCNIHFKPNTSQNQYCSIMSSGTLQLKNFDCNVSYPQFYCNKVRGYIYVSEPATYREAERICVNQFGTHLATIITYDDLQNVLETVNDTNVNTWIGLYHYLQYKDMVNKNVWLDGTEYAQIDPALHEIINLTGAYHCRSLQYNQTTISDTNNCNDFLPFLCNKRPKPTQYVLHKQNKTYDEAQKYCKREHNTDLATIIYEEELSDVMKIIPQFQSVWFGLHRQINNTDQLLWSDGTNCSNIINNKFCLSYWNNIYVNSTDNCGWLSKTGTYILNNCSRTSYFLCNTPPTDYYINSLYQVGYSGYRIDSPQLENKTSKYPGSGPGFEPGWATISWTNQVPDLSYRTIYKGINSDNLLNAYQLFSDMQQLNKDYYPPIIGNVILCQDHMEELCSHRIGPVHFSAKLFLYEPIAINTNFDVNYTVLYRMQNASDVDEITVTFFYYAIYATERYRDSILDEITQTFPTWQNSYSSVESTGGAVNGLWGRCSHTYKDLDVLYQEIGSPSDWKEKFLNYYIEPVYDQLVIYIYGIMAACSNEDIYHRLLAYNGSLVSNTSFPNTSITTLPPITTTNGEENKGFTTWMTVGIIFIVLFAVTVTIISVIVTQIKRREKNNKRGYSKADVHEVEIEETNDILIQSTDIKS